MSFSNRKLFELVEDIYRASTDPGNWQRVVDGIQSFLPGTGVNLQGHRGATTPQVLFVGQGYDPAFVAGFQKDHADKNPWVRHIPAMPVGIPHVIEESKYLEQVRRTEFHSYLLQNGWGSGLGLPIWTAPERLLFLVIDYPSNKAEKLDKPAARLARLLSPHMARSFACSHRLSVSDPPQTDLLFVLERTPSPVVVLDATRRVRFANAAGEALLGKLQIFRPSTCGRVMLSDCVADQALAEAVSSTVEGDLVQSSPMLISASDSRSELKIAVVPLMADGSLTKGSTGLFVAAERLALLFFIHKGTRNTQMLFRQTLGLTSAEAELAAALSEGQGLAEYASRRGVSLATVRNQLQAIFGKTFTHRQGELVALLARLSRGLPAGASTSTSSIHP